MTAPVISVIIPVYQAETTLRRCLDSILSQTFREIEVLLVNDGSTDKSSDVCSEYAKNDNRVRFFSKCHSGVSDTRQIGLEHAVGEYLIHCDSDDWMESNMLNLLYLKAKETNADMVVCDYYKEGFSSSLIYKEIRGDFSSSNIFENQLLSLSIDLWNKLVRRSLFEKFDINFPKGLIMGEDLYVTMKLLSHSIKIAYVPECLYHYDHSFIHNNLTATWSRSSVISNIKAINLIEPYLSGILMKKLDENKIYLIVTAHRNKLLSNKEIKSLFPEVHKSIVITSLHKWSLIPLSIKLLM